MLLNNDIDFREDLVRASSVDSTRKELMCTSDFCDGTGGSKVGYDIP